MIRVGSSPGKGRGIFSTRKIFEGETIDKAPVVIVPREQAAHLDATTLGDYYFLWGEDESDAALLLGLCSLCNHSFQPNARFVLHAAELAIEFIALRDIEPAEEITTNYHGDPANQEPVWFKTLP